MRNLVRFALRIGAISLVVGCSQARVPVVPSGPSPEHSLARARTSSSYRIVYNFGKAPDGDGPIGSLAYLNGTLYGATRSGGRYDCSSGTGYLFGCGTAFGVTTSGTEVMLQPFTIGNGAEPVSGLIGVKGTFYGTTTLGGSRRGGTAYSITPGGSETVIFNFDRRNRSPSYPMTEMIDVNGMFYGTTAGGGALRDGTVFSLTMAGKIDVLHHFQGGSDGAHPSGRLLDVGGTLYGTTSKGGGSCGCGTVYSITRSGVENVLYRFGGGNDGATPQGRLLEVNGILYGATTTDGAYGDGTIFSLTTSGKETVLHAFSSGDGAYPSGDLIAVNGILYGTTQQGGSNGQQYGTVFSMTLKGKEKVLHSFGGPPDGVSPHGGLIAVGKTLYGSTISGGSPPCRYTTYSHGVYECGTIFAISLPH